MPKVRILLCPADTATDFHFGRTGREALVKRNLHKYLTLPPIECWQVGELAAEEMFDLTNNPSRQEERLERYGNGRSLSVGDIVKVDDDLWLCDSFGWKVIK